MDMRLRVAANIPLAADMRIASGRYTMLTGLREAGISNLITALAARYGIGRHGWDWVELGEPVGRNNSRQAAYYAHVTGPAGAPALVGYAWLSLPAACQNGLLAIVDLRLSFAGIRPGPDGSGSPVPAELRVSPSELVDIFASGWQAATMVLPLAATGNPAALPPAGAPRLELYIQNEQPELSGSPRPGGCSTWSTCPPMGSPAHVSSGTYQWASRTDRATQRKNPFAHGFPAGPVFSRGPGESYADVARRARADVLVEDDCESIGGAAQMTAPALRAAGTVIRCVAVAEFDGLAHLRDDPAELGAG